MEAAKKIFYRAWKFPRTVHRPDGPGLEIGIAILLAVAPPLPPAVEHDLPALIEPPRDAGLNVLRLDGQSENSFICGLVRCLASRYTIARMNTAAIHPLIILLGTQLLYTTSDFMGRYYMKTHGFDAGMLTSGWFWGYQLIRQIAMFGQLYVFAHIPLGKTMALLGATSIILSNVLGFLFLREALSPIAYLGVALAVAAILVMALR
jgi:multidrug transporter EmrE-like cation transporter